MPLESPESSLLIEGLTSEISKLSDQQNALLKRAPFLGMTEKENRTFNERAARISALVNRLEAVSEGVSSVPRRAP